MVDKDKKKKISRKKWGWVEGGEGKGMESDLFSLTQWYPQGKKAWCSAILFS